MATHNWCQILSDRNLETLLPRSNQHVSRIRSIPIPVFHIACKPPEEDYAHAQAEVDDHEQTVIGSEGIRISNVQKIQHVNWDQHSQMGIGLGMLPGNHCKDWTSLQYNNETNLLGNNMLHGKRLTNKTATQKPLQDLICRLSLWPFIVLFWRPPKTVYGSSVTI